MQERHKKERLLTQSIYVHRRINMVKRGQEKSIGRGKKILPAVSGILILILTALASSIGFWMENLALPRRVSAPPPSALPPEPALALCGGAGGLLNGPRALREERVEEEGEDVVVAVAAVVAEAIEAGLAGGGCLEVAEELAADWLLLAAAAWRSFKSAALFLAFWTNIDDII